MPTRKRITIRIETHQFWRVSDREVLPHLWCAGCGAQVCQLDAQQAAALAGLTVRALCRLVEAGLLHATDAPDGALLVCLNTLLRRTPTESLTND